MATELCENVKGRRPTKAREVCRVEEKKSSRWLLLKHPGQVTMGRDNNAGALLWRRRRAEGGDHCPSKAKAQLPLFITGPAKLGITGGRELCRRRKKEVRRKRRTIISQEIQFVPAKGSVTRHFTD